MHVNPVQVIVDPVTVLWLNAFACNLTKSLSASGGSAPPPYLDLRLEAIMPRLVLETAQDYPLQRDRPSTLHLQTTRLLVCNYRSPDPTAPGYVVMYFWGYCTTIPLSSVPKLSIWVRDDTQWWIISTLAHDFSSEFPTLRQVAGRADKLSGAAAGR